MSKADVYRLRIEFSTIRAELCDSDELRTTWLRIRESYEHLLEIELKMAADLTLDLICSQAHAESGALLTKASLRGSL